MGREAQATGKALIVPGLGGTQAACQERSLPPAGWVCSPGTPLRATGVLCWRADSTAWCPVAFCAGLPATEGRICSFWGSAPFLHPPPFFQRTDSRSNPRLPPDYTTAGTKPRYLPTLPTSPPAAGVMPRPWQPLVLPTCPARSSSSLVLSSPSPEHG